MRRPSPGAALALASWLTVGCGARSPLPPPRLPLSAHLALPERSPAGPPTAQAPTLVVHDVTLPCGIEVHLVPRPDALVGHIAMFGGGGFLGDGGPTVDDVVLTAALDDHLDGSAQIDERGVVILSEVAGPVTLAQVASFVDLATGARLPAEVLERASVATTDARRTSMIRRGPDLQYQLAARVYGGRSARAAYANPYLARHAPPSGRLQARLRRLLDPARVRIVVVGPVAPEAMTAHLLELTSGVPAAPHGSPRVLTATRWEPPRPQLLGYGTSAGVGEVLAMGPGPSASAPEHAAFRVAVRLLGGMYSSRPNMVFREERRESYGAHAQIADRGTHSIVQFAITSRTPEIDDVLALLFAELGRLGDPGQLDESEVARARHLEIVSEVARWEDGSSLARAILDERIRGRAPSPEASVRALGLVDRDAVARAARRWLTPRALAVAAIGEGTWIYTHELSAPGGYERAH